MQHRERRPTLPPGRLVAIPGGVVAMLIVSGGGSFCVAPVAASRPPVRGTGGASPSDDLPARAEPWRGDAAGWPAGAGVEAAADRRGGGATRGAVCPLH